MKRNMAKIIKAYQIKYLDQNNDQFYGTDVSQLLNMPTDICERIYNALKVGFMLGYQKALRDQKNAK